MGFDFQVEYKPGAANAIADALSRCDTANGALLTLSAPCFDFLDRLRQAQATDPALVALRDDIATGSRGLPWATVDDIVQFAGRLLLGILNANRKIRKRTDTDVAFTREYSRVSIFHRERECTN